MGFEQITLHSPLGRRKFLISGVSTFLLILISPVLKLFGRTNHSKDICSGDPDRLLGIVQKYGAEFGGKNVFWLSNIKNGGQNVRI